MKPVRLVPLLAVVALPSLVALLGACPKKETEESAATTTAVTATPTPAPATSTTTSTSTSAMDAGTADAAADADAGKPPTGVSNLEKCCRAIEQNMKNAPPEQQGAYVIALAACRSGQIPAQFRNLPQCK